MAGYLYIVGTPIGNIQDITFRAVETLRSADIIACEDTRHTKILLDKYHIKTPTTSYHKFNMKTKTAFIINKLKEGKKVALVSDAGMPGISDPGQELVKAAAGEGIKIEVIPGASALIAALSVSGLKTESFAFEGFPPVKPSARKEFSRSCHVKRGRSYYMKHLIASWKPLKILKAVSGTGKCVLRGN